jgi:hypothetical protein
LRLGPLKSGLRPLDEDIPLDFRHGDGHPFWLQSLPLRLQRTTGPTRFATRSLL